MQYKGLEIDDSLYDYIKHIKNLEKYRTELQELQIVWDNLTLLGRLSKLSIDMSDSRRAFQQLTSYLLNHLSLETLKKSSMELKFKAQLAIDMMVRNLYERTADIGFFATDDDIRRYVTALANHTNDQLEGLKTNLGNRFQEYAAKYSVYNNIILLDTHGTLLLQLDQRNACTVSHDPLIAESLTTKQQYVETFRYSDLEPGSANSLIYSCRVMDDTNSKAIAVICLCFRFDNECQGIFANLLTNSSHHLMALLNAEGRVIASADITKLPLNSKLSFNQDGAAHTVRYQGREYLACSRKATAYQGYSGPPWFGHAMVPLEFAFRDGEPQLQNVLSAEADLCIMKSPVLFDQRLRAIPEQAELIQRNLNRSVWNGNLEQNSNKDKANVAISKELLKEIRNTSIETKAIFEKSIADLQHTVLQSTLNNCVFLAGLAIDIMDRNLYERSNDCRWWALNSTFIELLESSPPSPLLTQKISKILNYINSLYTVYTNLIVFDKQGRIVAVSKEEDSASLVGTQLSEPWAKSLLLASNSQTYSVSAFEKTYLYNDMHSYIYAAPIRGEGSQILGGIALVFDSSPQFKAMLQDALPTDIEGQPLPGSFTVFTDRGKKVIACSDDTFASGDYLDIADDFFQIDQGASISRIVSFNSNYYAVGCKMSQGYREYKQAGQGYQNDVLAIVFTYLNHEEDRSEPPSIVSTPVHSNVDAVIYGNTMLIASFYLNTLWFGLAADNVVAALAINTITPSHHRHPAVAGFVLYQGETVWTVRLSALLNVPPYQDQQDLELVIMRFDDRSLVALIVDQLGETIDVRDDAIQPVEAVSSQHNHIVDKVVVTQSNHPRALMLQLINPQLLEPLVKAAISSQ